METIRNVISTRGAQLVARFATYGVSAVAGKLGLSMAEGQAENVAAFAASVLVALVLMGIDFYSHKKQAE